MKPNSILRNWLFYLIAFSYFHAAYAQNDLPPPSATVETIPAGAWIIPMDNNWQGTAGIMNLKAYGLLNQLLWNNIHLKWAIKAGKGKDSTDFKAIAYQNFPTVTTSRLIAGQNFEATTLTPNWTYAVLGGGTNSTAGKFNDARSYRMTRSNAVTMSNISLTDYSNVQLSVAFASVGNPPVSADLHLDISYDNGATWTGTGSIRLARGDGATSFNINATNGNTVTPNPYIVNIPGSASQVRVRLRCSSTGTWGTSYYFVDDIKLTGNYNRSFLAGPFIIMPADTANARTVINNYNAPLAAAEKVNVYKAESAFNADIRHNVSHKPKLAIYDDGGNANIHEDVYLAAGITSTYYTIISSGTVIDSVNCYTLASTPHWGLSSYTRSDSARLNNLKSFLRSGGNFLAQCEGIDAIENYAPSRYLTTNGVNTLNASVTTIQYRNPDMPVMQFHGAMAGSSGSIRNFNILSGSWVWPRYIGTYFIDGTGDTANIINTTKINETDDVGGICTFLGGHDYNGTGLTDINGMRILLNMMMMPAKDLQADVTATSNSPVCPGDTIKLFGNIHGGFNFSWSGPNGFSSTQQNPTIANANSAKGGTYTLLMTVPPGGGGCGYTYNTTTVVVSKPSLTTTASQLVICQGDSTTLSFAPSAGISTANWYKNTGSTCIPNGQFMGSGLTLKVAPDSTTKYTAIGITTTGGCADTAVNCVTVTVDRRPVITSATSTSIGACYGNGVTATITGGSGGTGCSDNYQWRQDAGSWQAYTSGTNVGTTARDSIEIRVVRSCSQGCNITVRSRWIVSPQIITTSNYTMTNCADVNGYIAQLSATNPSPNTGIWTKVSGPGTVLSPTTYNASITGITPGLTAVVKWVVTNSIGCKDSVIHNITAPTIDATLVSKYDNRYCLTCPIRNGNTFTYYDLDGKILMQVTDINDATQMGSTEVCADLPYNVSGNPGPSDVELINNSTDQPYLPRSWSVNPDTTTATYQVAMYFTDEELNALMGRASGTQWSFDDVTDLAVTGYPNVSTNYTEPGGPNGSFYQPTFTRVGGYWAVSVTAIGARTFFLHPITYPWATLPVELVSFTATPMETFIRLNWSTASELNNHHFDIERSTDGSNFELIGVVEGGGTTHEPRYYEYDDNDVEFNTLYYYRLKQVDLDKTAKGSRIVTAIIRKAEAFSVGDPMPNPTQGYTFIELNNTDNDHVNVSIWSIDGIQVTQGQFPLNEGMNQLSLNLSDLSAGTYLCRFETNSGVVIKKLIKAK